MNNGLESAIKDFDVKYKNTHTRAFNDDWIQFDPPYASSQLGYKVHIIIPPNEHYKTIMEEIKKFLLIKGYSFKCPTFDMSDEMGARAFTIYNSSQVENFYEHFKIIQEHISKKYNPPENYNSEVHQINQNLPHFVYRNDKGENDKYYKGPFKNEWLKDNDNPFLKFTDISNEEKDHMKTAFKQFLDSIQHIKESSSNENRKNALSNLQSGLKKSFPQLCNNGPVMKYQIDDNFNSVYKTTLETITELRNERSIAREFWDTFKKGIGKFTKKEYNSQSKLSAALGLFSQKLYSEPQCGFVTKKNMSSLKTNFKAMSNKPLDSTNP